MRRLIVGLGGTTRPNSSSERAVRVVLEHAASYDVDVLMFGGPEVALPLYAPEVPFRTAEAQRMINALRMADGIVLGSPGYHGLISGLLKNALDYCEDMRDDPRPYFDGRAVGCVVCAAGWQAVGSTLAALRSVVHALRGWPTPLGVGINTVAIKAFDENGACIDEGVERQLKMVADQVVDFASRSRSGPPA
jgi:FMN reductase